MLAVWRPRKRCPTPRSTVFLIYSPHLDIRSRGQTPTWRCLHILARFENNASQTAVELAAGWVPKDVARYSER